MADGGGKAEEIRAAFDAALARQEGPPPPGGAPGRGPGAYVVNRRGERVPVCFDEITERNRALAEDPRYGPPLKAGGPEVTQAVVARFRPGMTTRELDDLAVRELAASSGGPDGLRLAARICASDLQKRMPAGFGAWLGALLGAAPSRKAARVSEGLLEAARRGAGAIEGALEPRRDYAFDFFGLQTLAKNYALSPGGKDPAPSTLAAESLHELPCHLYMRVALGVVLGGGGGALGEGAFEARLAEALRLYRALSGHLVSHATPTVLNAGTLHPQMSSCFQLGVGDDLESIFKAVGDAGLISKYGGGISFELGGVRSAGALIAGTGGRSRGLVPLARLLERVQGYADQGGNRRGAFAAYCPVDHADVLEFLELPLRRGAAGASAPEMKYALWVSDDFMRALAAELREPGAPAEWHLFCPAAAPGLNRAYGPAYSELRRRYAAEGRAAKVVRPSAIIRAAFAAWAEAGVPYVLFKDAVNLKSNLQNVAPITSSNLCVAGGTRVLTDRGQLPIAELAAAAAPVRVWNGAEWSEVLPVQTAEAAELLRVSLDDGGLLDCTPDHKFYLAGREGPVRARELAAGDPLEGAEAMPVVGGGRPLPGAYSAGLLAAAGLAGLAGLAGPGGPGAPAPPQGADVESRLEWFAGLCDGGATVPRGRGGCALRLEAAEPGFLREVRLLLQTLGCRPAVEEAPRPAGPLKARYRLRASAEDLDQLLGLGFRPRGLSFGGRAAREGAAAVAAVRAVRAARVVRVVRVERLPGRHPTFCFAEPKRHRGVFEGTLTGQCSEVLLPAWSGFDAEAFGAFHPDNAAGGEYGVCNLAAVCLGKFVREGPGGPALDYAGVAGAAGLLAGSLNRVIDGSFYPTPECERSNRRHRPIGVGLMGYADVLASLGLPYGSPRALRVARAAAAALYYGALSESCRLAEADGPYASFAGSPASRGLLAPDLWAKEGHLAPGWEAEVAEETGWLDAAAWEGLRARAAAGLRNAYVTAYMPTATTSAIVGQTESFEPFAALIFVRKTQTGDFLVVNPHFHAALEARGLWSDELRRQVIADSGSVQGVFGVPADLKAVFRTAREVAPEATIATAAAMAPFVCQSLSMNLFLAEPRLPKILSFLMAGWKAGLKTGLYYCHTAPAASGLQTSVRAGPPAAPAAPAAPAPPPAAPAAPAAPTEPTEPTAPVGEYCVRGGGCEACGV